MSLRFRIALYLRISLTVAVTGWITAACSDSTADYPESLSRAIDLFYLENKNDSVLTLLASPEFVRQPDEVKQLALLFRAAAVCEQGYPDSASTILQRVRPDKLSGKSTEYFNNIKGLIEFRQFKPEEAYLTLLELVNHPAKDVRPLALSERLLGRILFNYSDNNNALDWMMQSRRSYEKAGLDKSVAVNNKFIGNICIKLNLYDEALPYLNQAVTTFTEYNDSLELFYVYIVLADLHILRKELDEAEMYVQKSTGAADINRDGTLQALVHNNRGEIEKLRGNYERSAELFDSTLMMGTNYYNSIQRRQFAYLNLAEVYNYLNEPEKARENALLALSTITGNRKNDVKYEIYLQLAKSYAYSDIPAMKNLLDSAMLFQHNYQVSQSVDLIRFFDTQQELNESRQRVEQLRTTGKTHRTIYIIFAIALLIVILTLSILYRIRNDRNKALRELVNKNLILLDEQKKLNEERWHRQKTTNRKAVTTTDEERSKTIYNDLIHWLADEGNFKRNDITLETAAKELNTNREYLSRAISLHKVHFTELVNKYRVQEVMKVFATPDDARNKLTLQVLATEVGFNSSSVFIDAFRRQTGMTPTQFRDNLSQNNHTANR